VTAMSEPIVTTMSWWKFLKSDPETAMSEPIMSDNNVSLVEIFEI